GVRARWRAGLGSPAVRDIRRHQRSGEKRRRKKGSPTMLLEIIVFAIVLSLLVIGIYGATRTVVIQQDPRAAREQQPSSAAPDPERAARAERAMQLAMLHAAQHRASVAGDVARADQIEAEIRELKRAS